MRTDVPEFDKKMGMLCWLTNNDGIYGSVKERYEDFLVEEVLPDGTILTLENPRLKFSGYEGLFTHFVLVKKGIGNFEAVWYLAEKLGVPCGFFFYSGNKDRDALTVQRMAVWGVSPEELLQLKLPETIKIYSPIRELRRIHIGEHLGNRFTIFIRKIAEKDTSKLEKLLTEIENIGYLPNFFSYQRFGLLRPISHYVGKLLLLRRYEDALRLYLASPALIDDEKMLGIKRMILQGDYRNAIRELPRKGFIFERILLNELIKRREPKIVWKKVPRFLLRMLVEAYQAYLFNLTLSKLLIENYDLVKSNPRIPVIGYNVKVQKIGNTIAKILHDILNEEHFDLRFFKNEDFPPLSLKGTLRYALLRIQFDLRKIIEDSNGHYTCVLRFVLKKGEYATIVLREIFKHYTLMAFLSSSFETQANRILENLEKIQKFTTSILRGSGCLSQ